MSDEPVSEPVVKVTLPTIYNAVLETKDAVAALRLERAADAAAISDHEDRIRLIESRENLTAQVAELRADVKNLQRRVWALPSLGVVIAAGSLLVVLIKTF